ncbi:TPA: hypothetical protein ACTYZB_004850 [Klebsiella variicola]
MSSKPTGNQFGQIVTCVAAARVMAHRFGCIPDFGSFESHYTDPLIRQSIIESSEALFDAQWAGDSSLVYLGNVFGPDHMGDGVIVSKNEDTDISFNPIKSARMASRIQHMSVRLAVRRTQNNMSRIGVRKNSRAFDKVEMSVKRVSEGVLHFGISFDEKVKTGFIVPADDQSDDNLNYANETMGKLASCITEMWPGVISGFSNNLVGEDVLDEFSEVYELRKSNPIWGTW